VRLLLWRFSQVTAASTSSSSASGAAIDPADNQVGFQGDFTLDEQRPIRVRATFLHSDAWMVAGLREYSSAWAHRVIVIKLFAFHD